MYIPEGSGSMLSSHFIPIEMRGIGKVLYFSFTTGFLTSETVGLVFCNTRDQFFVSSKTV